jgi:hypothetical protein
METLIARHEVRYIEACGSKAASLDWRRHKIVGSCIELKTKETEPELLVDPHYEVTKTVLSKYGWKVFSGGG